MQPEEKETAIVVDEELSREWRAGAGRTWRRRGAHALLAAVLLAVAPASADPPPGAINLGVAGLNPTIDGDLLAFAADERNQQVDLNGDGDMDDVVAHIYDSVAGTTRNLGLHGIPHLDGGLLAFGVGEAFQGHVDLNGDGDANDNVLHIHDYAANTTRNVGLDSRDPFRERLNGNFVTIHVSEFDQAGADLNGDGDTDDVVLHIHDYAANTTRNLGFDSFRIGKIDAEISGNLIAFIVIEAGQDHTDLNGDGDADDAVLHVHDYAANTTRNLGVAVDGFKLDGNLIAFQVDETAQGVDRNGDGDMDDTVLHVHDLAAASTRNLGFDTFGFNIDGSLIAFEVSEAGEGMDFTGDGETNDFALHVHDFAANTTRNLGLATEGIQPNVVGNLVVFNVAEEDVDLDGNGATTDKVLHIHDFAANTTRNLGLSTGGARMDGDLVEFIVWEQAEGVDLNGDGDVGSEFVLHVHDYSANRTINIGVAVRSIDLGGPLVAFEVREDQQGETDLNGDGDISDSVLHFYDLTDTDGDGLPDSDETALGTDPADADSDDDGLIDGDEVDLGTDLTDPDSDGDGLSDGDEVVLGTDPTDPDSDGDGLSDGDEVDSGTDPTDPDSDGDGLPDGMDPDTVADVVAMLPAGSFNSDGGNRNATLTILEGIERLIAAGDNAEALRRLENLRRRLDGCGATADSNDWIIVCESQHEVGTLVDVLIANLSS